MNENSFVSNVESHREKENPRDFSLIIFEMVFVVMFVVVVAFSFTLNYILYTLYIFCLTVFILSFIS